ncbi:hypothetical protein HYE82_19940 [Streptomyces sp. BR123]|nr:hypothetical protein [Streptomyces sp. BR123]
MADDAKHYRLSRDFQAACQALGAPAEVHPPALPLDEREGPCLGAPPDLFRIRDWTTETYAYRAEGLPSQPGRRVHTG